MAFVSCDSRWKQNIDNSHPGPGEYELSRLLTPQKKPSTHSHHRSPNLKKTQPQHPHQHQDCTFPIKTWYSHQHTPVIIDPNLANRKPPQKTGKIYRKNMSHKLLTNLCSPEEQIKLEIKPGDKTKSHALDRDKWGNTRIVELLKEHEKERSRNPLKKYSGTSKRNVFTNQVRDKLQVDLKQMEILFNSHRNRNDNTLSLKNLHREISSKQKQREANSHNYYLTVNRAKTGIQSHQSQGEFTIQPSAIYRSPPDETFISRPQTGFGQSGIYSVENSSMQKMPKKEQSIPTATGISDDLLQDSMEYIQDATPGPGSYNLDTSVVSRMTKQGGKKIEKFGVTMERFKIHRDISQPQTLINPTYPAFKKSSQARQEEVGFGRSTKEEKDPQKYHSGVYYQDLNNLENVSKKTLLKAKSSNVGFQSGKERFSYSSNKKEWYEEEEDQIEQEEQEVPELQKVPSSVFLSKVKRQISAPHTITENVDFTAQNYSCLANKLKKQQEFYQDYEIKPAPFLAKDSRFKYEEPCKQDKLEELKLIKIKQLKEKKEKKKSKPSKGFSFGRSMKKEEGLKESPSPDRYELQGQWVKKTYNLRFR